MQFYPKNINDNRIYEIDFLRGIAIILMIIFHWFYFLDLRTHSTYSNSITLQILGSFARISFIFLLGVSLNLSYQNKTSNKKYNERQLLRVFFLFIYSLLITLTSRLAFPDKFIRFGILHFMTITLLLLSFIMYLPKYIPLILGMIMYVVFVFEMQNKHTDSTFLSCLGYKPSYNTIDHFPLFKWFWVSSLGVLVGSKLYKNGKCNYKSLNLQQYPLTKNISFMGRYSLEIYLLHLPIIYSIQSILFNSYPQY